MDKHWKIVADIIAIGGSMIGSTLVAINIGLGEYGYIAYFFSGCATMYLLKDSDVSKSIKIITLYFMIINFVGFFRF